MRYLEAFDATEAFELAYRAVETYGEKVESRIGETKHLTNMTICIQDPRHGVCLDPTRNMSLRYMLGEIQWYMSGSNRVKDIAKFAKMWADLSDDGKTVNSAYGYRIQKMFGFNQLKYCIEKLKKNRYDRQCVIHIKDASDKPTKDTPCTVSLQFTYERGFLSLHTYMRSNDIWLGLPYDVAFFTCLQQIVAHEIGACLGGYYHTVGDLHLYKKHWGKPVDFIPKLFDPSRQSSVYEPWCISKESKESLDKMLNGEEPTNKTLKTLWRMNNDQKNKSVGSGA